MTRELNSLLARLDDVVERMPDCFNTYEFAQKLALQHQREFFAAGHSLAEQEGRLLRVLHEKIAEALAGSCDAALPPAVSLGCTPSPLSRCLKAPCVPPSTARARRRAAPGDRVRDPALRSRAIAAGRLSLPASVPAPRSSSRHSRGYRL